MVVAEARPHVARRLRWGVFLWAQVVLLLWWAGERPGLLSPDSVSYVKHVTVGPWTADHSVLYDTAVLGSLSITHGIGLLTIVQTTAAAAVLAYSVRSLNLLGVPGRWAALPGIVLPLLPSFGAFVVTVWKDVPFALCELLIAATVLRLIAARPGSAPGALLVAFGLELLALALFRNDGFLFVAGIAALCAVALQGWRVKILGAGAAALAGFFLAQQVVYPAAGIAPANSSLSYGIFYADVAIAYAEEPSSFTAADTALLAQVAPLSAWRTADNCFTSDPLFAMPRFDLARAAAHHVELFALWRRVAVRTPGTVLRARLCRGSIAWNVLPPPERRAHFAGTTAPTPPDLYGAAAELPPDVVANLQQRPLVPALGRWTRSLAQVSGPSWLRAVEWRGATWCYFAYAALAIAALRRRSWVLLAAGAVSLVNQIVVLGVNPAQLYRYMVGPIFLGILLLPVLALRPVAERHAGGDPP